jgi:glutathione S-transferase
MRRLAAVASSFVASAVRGAAGRAVVRLGERPVQPLELYDAEQHPGARLVREALSMLDLDALVLPCPRGGERFVPGLEARSGRRSVPYLVDPNLGLELGDPGEIVRHLFRTYGDGRVPLRLALRTPVAVSSRLASATRGGAGVHALTSLAPRRMLELYSFEACPYCRLVREELCALELPYVLRNVARDSPRRAAFVARTGRMQVPWLHDPNTGTSLFESARITAYLHATYGAGAGAAQRQPSAAATKSRARWASA